MHKRITSTEFESLTKEEQVSQFMRVSDTLSDVIKKAKHNEATQIKFYTLELKLLQSTSIESLFKQLYQGLTQDLDLAVVDIQLIDKDREIQNLVSDIYGQLELPHIRYIADEQPISAIYDDSSLKSEAYLPLLSQESSFVNKCFEHQTKRAYSVALLPLICRNKLIGAAALGSSNKHRFSPDLATSFMQHLGSIIAICIENAVTQEQFKLLSLVDRLTRTKNRRYFMQALSREIARSSRSMNPLSCLFLDIDHFKQVNDTHGHMVGDEALKATAKAIKPLLRQSDVLARFGGEEFMVMLPDTDETHAIEIAERIRKVITQIQLINDHRQPFSISASVGVSTWSPKHALPIESHSENSFAEHIDKNSATNPQSFERILDYLIRKSDEGVYLAKRNGRNCVRVA